MNDLTWNMQEFYKIFLLKLIWYLFFNKIIALEDIKYFFLQGRTVLSSSSNGFYSTHIYQSTILRTTIKYTKHWNTIMIVVDI